MNAPAANRLDRCPCSQTGNHLPWKVLRFDWPWGLLVPRVFRCLLCSRRVR